ncbi:MAG: ABC transporter permease subunit [Christensenellaceae bacterium]|nr:ABC transporter permease subunit [Christensenellaceae bacterium]
MKTMLAFIKKECIEQLRTGKLVILSIISIFIGILNPLTAKLTPWLFEMLADTLAESGISFTGFAISAMDSWMQFFKNAPMALIAFVLIESSIFVKEYQSGTLVLAVTKGLERHKIVFSKAALLTLLWTVYYWLSFIITYIYSSYFWDNSVANNLLFAAICWWAFGVFVIMLIVLFSTIANSNGAVLGGIVSVLLISYLTSLLPNTNKCAPTLLTDGYSLIHGIKAVHEYTDTLITTITLSILCFITSIPIFNKK